MSVEYPSRPWEKYFLLQNDLSLKTFGKLKGAAVLKVPEIVRVTLTRAPTIDDCRIVHDETDVLQVGERKCFPE